MNSRIINKDYVMQLIYSEDDKGYYYQRFNDWKVSVKLFKTEQKAITARENNQLTWE